MVPFVPFIVIGSLVLLYIGSYYFNKKTAIPEECLTAAELATCNSCSNFSCSHHGGA